MEDTANTNDANEYSTGDEIEVIDIGSNQGVVIEPRSRSDAHSIRRPDEVSLFIPHTHASGILIVHELIHSSLDNLCVQSFKYYLFIIRLSVLKFLVQVTAILLDPLAE